MKIEEQVCTAQQAAKLQELGIAAPSLHQWWKMKYPASEEAFAKNRANCLITPTGDNHDRFIMHYIDNENASFHWEEGTYGDGWDHSRCELEEGPVAAYTVAELGEMLPTGFDTMRIHSEDYDKELWYIYGDTGDWFIKNGFDTEAECRAETVIKLLESNLITPEQINKRLQQ